MSTIHMLADKQAIAHLSESPVFFAIRHRANSLFPVSQALTQRVGRGFCELFLDV